MCVPSVYPQIPGLTTPPSYVLTIHSLVEQYGIAFLRDWLGLMQDRHPLGAVPVDEAVWQLAAELTGQPPVPRHPTVCTGFDVIN